MFLVVFSDADRAAPHFVGEIGERNEVEHLVDEFDDGAVFGEFVCDTVGDAIGGDQDRWYAWTLIEWKAARIARTDAWAGVVVVAVRLVVRDQDYGLRPIWAGGNGVDFAGEERFGEL